MPYPARMFNCARCACQVVICSHCDRGQIYCAVDCAHAARKESLCQSGQRYQASRQGQLKHAARQARYRERQQQKVTHQGSDPGTHHDSLMPTMRVITDITDPDLIQKILDHIRGPPRPQPPPVNIATARQP